MSVLKLSTKNVQKVFEFIKNKNFKFFDRVKQLWAKDAQVVIGNIVKKYYTGRPGLNRKSGNAARIFLSNTQRVGANVIQKIFIDQTNPAKTYINIHDRSRSGTGIISAKNGPLLTFKVKNRWVKVPKVFIPIRTNVLSILNKEAPKLRLRSLNAAVKVFK